MHIVRIYLIGQVILMKLEHRVKPRDTKSNPMTAIFASVFAMFIISALLLLILALILYKAEPGESVIKVGIVVVYVVAGFLGGFLMGKIMQEQKFLWGLAAGVIYFAVLFVASAVVGGGFDMEPAKVITTLILCAASGMAGGMVS